MPRRHQRLVSVGAAVAVALGAQACSGPASDEAPSAGGGPAATAAPVPGAATTASCVADVPAAPLPEWARTGFSPGAEVVPHVLGTRGEIVGVLFGQPFTAVPRVGQNNKILWITRADHPAGPLDISAALAGTTVTASRQVPDGPGPSVVDLPAPGCWRLTLTWPGHTDQVAVVYRPS